tara:strand:+ start:2856 stop:3899 length:1044 start_codon:yes stop_codon:yes gene_type:complete
MSNVLDDPQQGRLPLDTEDAAEAILARWEDAEETQPSEQETEATEEVVEETDDLTSEQEFVEEDDTAEDDEDPEYAVEEVEDDDDEEVEEEETEEVSYEVSDDTEVEIEVDGETQQASIKDLKRLYGQEASLTRKSQETAATRKKAEDALGKSSAVLQRMLEKAQERYKPYSDIDMLVASKQMTAEDFTQLRKEATEAETDLKFLQQEADQFYGEIQQKGQEALREKAQTCVRDLQERMPEWSNELYNDIRTYAIAQGLPEEQVNNYVDPNVIELINKARLYDQGKRVATVKKAKPMKKVLRSKKAPPSAMDKKAKRMDTARKKLQEPRRGQDLDDIADALMSRWEQ